MASIARPLLQLDSHAQLIVRGDRVVSIPDEVRRRFQPGDSLFYAEAVDELLLIPHRDKQAAERAVAAAAAAFEQMRGVEQVQVQRFYQEFARRLEEPSTWARIAEANREDVAEAKSRGRSTTRLVASDRMRQQMIEGLRGWQALGSARGRVLETVQHAGWAVDLVTAELGVVAFVFEGRPNVLADATGVLAGGNTVVFRIGRDALRTAKTIMHSALTPALREARLPEHAVGLLESAEHAAGWALFTDARVSLAVARGSGRAVAMLGSLARQTGVPVSLHGTGGAWLTCSEHADLADLERVVSASLDRKVCNTLNVCCIPRALAARGVPAFLRGLERSAAVRGQPFKLHLVREDVPDRDDVTGEAAAQLRELLQKRVSVARAQGKQEECQAEWIHEGELGREWEWEDSPEVTLKLVRDLDHAIQLFNTYSPQFVACLLSPDAAEQRHFFTNVNAPFVGDDYTRWVDGQLALRRPELGLSNWQHGRLLARGGVLSGDGIYTIRTRARRS